jgi:hypothetical protein
MPSSTLTLLGNQIMFWSIHKAFLILRNEYQGVTHHFYHVTIKNTEPKKKRTKTNIIRGAAIAHKLDFWPTRCPFNEARVVVSVCLQNIGSEIISDEKQYQIRNNLQSETIFNQKKSPIRNNLQSETISNQK